MPRLCCAHYEDQAEYQREGRENKLPFLIASLAFHELLYLSYIIVDIVPTASLIYF